MLLLQGCGQSEAEYRTKVAHWGQMADLVSGTYVPLLVAKDWQSVPWDARHLAWVEKLRGQIRDATRDLGVPPPGLEALHRQVIEAAVELDVILDRVLHERTRSPQELFYELKSRYATLSEVITRAKIAAP